MPYPASSYPEGVDLTIIAGNQLHQVINGEANEVVSTTSGDIPSVRKALADSMMFKVPIDWVQGEVTTDPLETRLYNGQPYWAPEATLANPITLGVSPVATTDWLLAPQGYRNEYNLGKYQAGILISDNLEYVVYDGKSYFATTPPYTTTATTPDNDTNMFAGNYSTEDVVINLQKEVLSGKVYPLTNTLQTGDEIPEGTTYVRVIGGDFIEETLVRLIDTEGNLVEPAGVVGVMELSVAPYIVQVGGDFLRLVNPEYWSEDSISVNTKMIYSERSIGFDKQSEALQISTNYAINTKRKYVVVDEDYTQAFVDYRKAQVIYIGSGNLPSTYRKKVVNLNSPTFRYFDNLSTVALKRFRQTSNPVVVFVGDSTYTLQPNVRSRTETLYSMVQNKLRQEFPEKEITFHNRAIGGQRWDHANSVPNRAIWWYTDPTFTKPWLDYVEDLNPDLVVLGFGMNDGADTSDFSPSAVRSVISKVRTLSEGTDVIVGTNLVPSIGTPQTGFSGKEAQEGRDYVAGYVRSYCMSNSVPILDFNRFETIIRDGYDIMNTNINRDVYRDSTGITNGTWLYGRELYDFKVEVYIQSTDPQYNLDIYNGVYGQFYVKVGPSREDVVFFGNDNGKVKLSFLSGGEAYKSITTTQDIPTGVINFHIEKSGTTFVYRDGSSDDDLDLVRIDDLITHGGVFNPAIGYYLQSDGPLDPAWVTTNYGVPTHYLPSSFDAELWGSPSTQNETRDEGGNGVNHPSSYGAKSIYYPVIDASNWKLPFTSRKPPRIIGTGITEIEPVICTVVDNVVTLNGIISLNGNTDLMAVSDDAIPTQSSTFILAVASDGLGGLSTTILRVSPSGFMKVASGQSIPATIYLSGVSYMINDQL